MSLFLVYAEKSEAAADQKKHIFNCIQRRLLISTQRATNNTY